MGRYQSEIRDEFFATIGGLAKEPDFRWGGNVNVAEDGSYWYHNSREREEDPDKPATFDDEGNVLTPAGTRRVRTLLGKFVSKKLLLINGAGFRLGSGETNEQTSLRTRGGNWAQMGEGRECITVPLPALESGGVDLNSIKPIDIQRDRWVDDFTVVEAIPDILENEEHRKNFTCTSHTASSTPCKQGELPEGFPWENLDDQNRTRDRMAMVWEGRWGGHRWRVSYRFQTYRNESWQIQNCEIWTTPDFAEAGWTGVQRFQVLNRERRDGDDPTRGGEEPGRFIQHVQQHWGAVDPKTPSSALVNIMPDYMRGRPEAREGKVTYGALSQIHRLGNSVFSARGSDGKRHRWISAFDEQEPRPMYFLAQLPDKRSCKSYQEAIDLLAPDIVHRAIADGRHVVRQGDVFAIETNQTTENVYRRGIARVRRDIALQREAAAFQRGRARNDYIEPDAGEVHVVDACPTCGHHGVRTGSGPRARAALSIFGTGHTATEVVVCKKGVTFIRGILYHDPQIEEPGRAREHIDFMLYTPEVSEKHANLGRRTAIDRDYMNEHPEDFKWYLAVRNTVPRQRTRRATADHAPEGEQVVATTNPRREGRRAA